MTGQLHSSDAQYPFDWGLSGTWRGREKSYKVRTGEQIPGTWLLKIVLHWPRHSCSIWNIYIQSCTCKPKSRRNAIL